MRISKLRQGILDDFLRYYNTPFALRSPTLMEDRFKSLGSGFRVAQEPVLEVVRRYASDTRSLEQICAEIAPKSRFAEFARQGLFTPSEPYVHQADALMQAQNQNVIIKSGTGSGKTEAFLLPTIFNIVEEADRTWSSPISKLCRNEWYNGSKNPFENQRFSETRPAAFRALVLYPMNALVEDQIRRLREALDSTGARAWCDKHLGGNRIFFGRYTGRTPVSGSPDASDTLRRYRSELRDLAV